jgi:8-oxo-dGTP pyrophosphatase MutT (NUDIX family)
VVLVSRHTPSGEVQWILPKGTQEEGETLEQTALREVREETGLATGLLGPLDTIDYWFVWNRGDTRYHKFVHHYLLLALGVNLDDHDDEVDEARWFDQAAAGGALTFANERRLLTLVPDALAAAGGGV